MIVTVLVKEIRLTRDFILTNTYSAALIFSVYSPLFRNTSWRHLGKDSYTVCRKSLFTPIKSDVFTNLSMKKTSQNKRNNIFTKKG